MAHEAVIKLQCHGCRKSLWAKPELAGRRAVCPRCKHAVTVPPLTKGEPPPIQPPPLPDQCKAEVVQAELELIEERFKKCPHCGIQIPADAVKCEHCHEPFYVLLRLRDFIGQEEIKQALDRRLSEASCMGMPFPHALFSGPPDSGKTTLATLLARDLGVGCQIANATDLRQERDLIPYLTNAEERSIFVIEDIDLLPEPVSDFLVPAVEDYRMDLTLGEGVNARIINMALRPFTLIGTTSRPSRVNRELLSWFTVYNFTPYSDTDFRYIAGIMAFDNKLGFPAESVPLVISCCESSLADLAVLMKRIRGYVGENANLRPTC